MLQSDKHELCEALHDTIQTGKGTAQAAADNLGKPYSTLHNEINGLTATEDNPARNKFGLLTALELLEVTRNPGPVVRWVNRHFGFLPPVRRKAVEAGAEALPLLLADALEELADVSRVLREALKDNKVDKGELARLKKEIDDVLQVVQTNEETAEAASRG